MNRWACPGTAQEVSRTLRQSVSLTLRLEGEAGHWTAELYDAQGRLLFDHTSAEREVASREVIRFAVLSAAARRS